MFDTFNATFNVATRTDATPANLRPVSGSTSSSGAPGTKDAGRGARLAYRLITAIGSMGR